jgi:hypothetical protein
VGASVQALAVGAQGLHVELSRGWPRHMNFLVDPTHDLSDRARTLPRRHGSRGCGCELSVARRRAAGSTERGCAERRRQRERREDAAVGEVEQPNAAAAAATCRRRGLRASTAQMGEFRSRQGGVAALLEYCAVLLEYCAVLLEYCAVLLEYCEYTRCLNPTPRGQRCCPSQPTTPAAAVL